MSSLILRGISTPLGAIAAATLSGARSGATLAGLWTKPRPEAPRGRSPSRRLKRRVGPHSHADYREAPVEALEVPSGDLRARFRWLRRRSAEVGWRAAVDSLRPHTQSLWQNLDEQEQLRFLRHARAWWDVRRSRIAP